MLSLIDLPENAGALAYLAHGRSPAEGAFGPPGADLDRWQLGTHPEIVARLWDLLNAALPADARWLVFDGPALVHPRGVILAAGMGTQYALRLPPARRAEAVAAGAELVHRFRTVGTTLDLPATFGADWVFGRRDAREAKWLLEEYRAIDAAGSSDERPSL